MTSSTTKKFHSTLMFSGEMKPAPYVRSGSESALATAGCDFHLICTCFPMVRLDDYSFIVSTCCMCLASSIMFVLPKETCCKDAAVLTNLLFCVQSQKTGVIFYNVSMLGESNNPNTILQVLVICPWSSSWWFWTCFYFHPENWGRSTHFDEHIFQLGGSTTNQSCIVWIGVWPTTTWGIFSSQPLLPTGCKPWSSTMASHSGDAPVGFCEDPKKTLQQISRKLPGRQT